MGHREFKDRAYAQFARVGAVLGSEKRLELIDLLAQAPRNVEALAEETGMSGANTSRHLQALKTARLVDSDREGTRVVYRLADERVLDLWLALRGTAESQLAEVGQLVRDYGVDGADDHVQRGDLRAILRGEDTVLLDVRPRIEYEHGHIPGAITMPIDELDQRVANLPRDKKVVVYCRGTYCRFADEAVSLLRQHGFDARRLQGGWPEWLSDRRAGSRGRRG